MILNTTFENSSSTDWRISDIRRDKAVAVHQ
jgi:hypothetical protein